MSASQGGGGTPGGNKGGNRRRTDNVVPVKVEDVLHSTGETLSIEGQEISMVVLVGQVKSVENAATKSIYRLEDKSGAEIECIHWADVSWLFTRA